MQPTPVRPLLAGGAIPPALPSSTRISARLKRVQERNPVSDPRECTGLVRRLAGVLHAGGEQLRQLRQCIAEDARTHRARSWAVQLARPIPAY